MASPAPKAPNKTDMILQIAESTGLPKKDVGMVVDALVDFATKSMVEVGAFKLNGLVQLIKIHKPATPARSGIHPFTKEPHEFPAKPAKNVIKASALKAVKDAITK